MLEGHEGIRAYSCCEGEHRELRAIHLPSQKRILVRWDAFQGNIRSHFELSRRLGDRSRQRSSSSLPLSLAARLAWKVEECSMRALNSPTVVCWSVERRPWQLRSVAAARSPLSKQLRATSTCNEPINREGGGPTPCRSL